jgi:hypothetical protein
LENKRDMVQEAEEHASCQGRRRGEAAQLLSAGLSALAA